MQIIDYRDALYWNKTFGKQSGGGGGLKFTDISKHRTLIAIVLRIIMQQTFALSNFFSNEWSPGLFDMHVWALISDVNTVSDIYSLEILMQ